MIPDYSPKFYQYSGTVAHKVQITQSLNDLHQIQLDMIDQAVEYSDLNKAKEVIDYIRGL
jgi:hypothetical protein